MVLMRNHQAALKQEVAAYKEAVRALVEEYFSSGSVPDVVEGLEELGASHLAHYFVKRLITTALDRKDREREMASTLLSGLYAEVGRRRAGQAFAQFLHTITLSCAPACGCPTRTLSAPNPMARLSLLHEPPASCTRTPVGDCSGAGGQGLLQPVRRAARPGAGRAGRTRAAVPLRNARRGGRRVAARHPFTHRPRECAQLGQRVVLAAL